MRIFSEGGEIRLTHADLLRALHVYLHNHILHTYSNEKLEDVYVDSLSLHPTNKYAARITLKRIPPKKAAPVNTESKAA